MVSKQEDSIDFGKLEEQVFDAVEADARYNRENDAKFRAVHQRVATYEEFRDIVLASHIKPLEKKDLMNTVDFKQPWNTHASKKTEETQTKDNAVLEKKKFEKVPKNGHEFTKEWRRICKCPLDKYNVLLSLGGPTLARIFKSEISFGLLGEFIEALSSEFQSDQAFEILKILESLSKTNRFQLSVQFMSSNEKSMCEKLFEKIKQVMDEAKTGDNENMSTDIDFSVLVETMKKFGLDTEYATGS